MEPIVRAPENEDEWRAADRIFQRGFGLHLDPDREDQALERQHRDRYLAVFVGEEVAAAAQVRPFGMFLGGRSIPLGGYSPVAVAPEWRGRGYGTRVTEAHFPHLRDRGEVLAGLYPASTRLYRGAGFEIAGVYVMHSVFTRHLNEVRPVVGWPTERRLTIEDADAIKACYRAYATTQNGWLDRSPGWWERIFENFPKEHWYGVDDERGGLAGYVRYRHERAAPPYSYDIVVLEMCADHADVAIGLWKLVGSSSSQANVTKVYGGHEHPLLHWLPEQDAKVGLDIRWMARVIDAAGAVAARGFPMGVRVSVDLEIQDRACHWNDGSWTLAVDGGRGELMRSADSDVRISASGLASLFTGYASASRLQQTGLISAGSPAAIAALDAAFAGPTPWTADFY